MVYAAYRQGRQQLIIHSKIRHVLQRGPCEDYLLDLDSLGVSSDESFTLRDSGPVSHQPSNASALTDFQGVTTTLHIKMEFKTFYLQVVIDHWSLQ